MNKELKKVEKGCEVAEKVVVAVKASKDIPKTALVWALTHVVQPGDCITLLVVFSSHLSGRKLWGFPRFAGDCASGHRAARAHSTGTSSEQKSDITDSCSQMILQLHDVYDPNKINVKIKVISGSPCGAVAFEAKKIHANWVVLDKHLKLEEKCCMEELQCNIVSMKRSQPKVLRLNLVGSAGKEPEPKPKPNQRVAQKGSPNPARGPHLVTPSSSPETFTPTEVGTSSVSSSEPGTFSPFFITDPKSDFNKKSKSISITESDSDSDSESLSSSSSLRLSEIAVKPKNKNPVVSKNALFEKNNDRSPSGSLREAIALSRGSGGPCGPPPLCTVCQHKTPVFGKPPKWFAYAELELATGGFSRASWPNTYSGGLV